MIVFYLVVMAPLIILSALLWIRLLRTLDIYAVRKRQLKVVPTFFAFGLLSGPFCYVFYWSNVMYPVLWSESSYYFLVNGPSEELAKFVVFYIVAKATGSVKDPADAVIQGASPPLNTLSMNVARRRRSTSRRLEERVP